MAVTLTLYRDERSRLERLLRRPRKLRPLVLPVTSRGELFWIGIDTNNAPVFVRPGVQITKVGGV